MAVKHAFLIVTVLSVAIASLTAAAHAYDRPDNKPAIVLAAFGTSDAEAVHSILNIVDRVEQAFPEYDVHLAFTSNIIRSIWRNRASNSQFRAENPTIPDRVYQAKNPLSTLAAIQETGARLVLVQSIHITDGEEYTDLANLVETLSSYATMKRSLHPFPWIGIGEPALGVGDGQPRYLERAADALAPLAAIAKETGAALVLMGHGNEHLNQNVFSALETVLRDRYGPQVYIGTVEAPPFADDIVDRITNSDTPPERVLLAPLMVVAGDHAKNDMAGDDEDSWTSVFTQSGLEVDCHLAGLGSNDSWADIYIEHLKALEFKVIQKQAAEKAQEQDETD